VRIPSGSPNENIALLCDVLIFYLKTGIRTGGSEEVRKQFGEIFANLFINLSKIFGFVLFFLFFYLFSIDFYVVLS
ncbi:MAG: hypothetical protein IIW16_01225, partial [Clostridia bacterium]|nr:hypothetical protein [Clostridia bacterium]